MGNSQQQQLSDEEADIYKLMIEYRRQIHQFPEMAFQETKTADFILSILQKAGFQEIYTGLAKTGIIAVLRGEQDVSILVRADMDGLPINEESDQPYKSQHQGVMHACGHDGHVAILLGLALTIKKRVDGGLTLKQGIKFCFQPGEEGGANGAKHMLADKEKYDIINSAPKVLNCYGLHISSMIKLNEIHYSTGPCSSRSESFEINVVGKGGHAKAPHLTIDALAIGAQIITAIYQIRGRNVDQCSPCAISIGKFDAGQVSNIICENAKILGSVYYYLKGKVRTLNKCDREDIFDKLEKICKGAAIQHDCKVEFKYLSGYNSVINHQSLKDVVVKAINKVAEHKEGTLKLGGEDFYNFSELVPSAFVLVGAALPDGIINGRCQRPHHSSKFDIDEKSLYIGYQFWLSLLEELQNQEQ